MTERTFVNGKLKACCQDAANLELLTEESNAATGLTVQRCKVCGCRHRRLVCEPGMVGWTFTNRRRTA